MLKKGTHCKQTLKNAPFSSKMKFNTCDGNQRMAPRGVRTPTATTST